MTRNQLLQYLNDRLHSDYFLSFAQLLQRVPLADLADALREQPVAPLAELLQTLTPPALASLFARLDAALQDALLPWLAEERLARLFADLPADIRVDIFNRQPPEQRALLLPLLAQAKRDAMLGLAAYPPGSTGAVTTSDFAAIPPGLQAGAALQLLREQAPGKETIYLVYVLDQASRLLGVISLRDLVLADPEAPVDTLMCAVPLTAQAAWPAAQAAAIIRRNELLALPVLDSGERMIGILTFDDAMDVEKEEDTTQLARFGGTAGSDGTELHFGHSSFAQMFKARVFWLILLTAFGMLGSTFVASQEDMLAQVLVLAAFIAPVIDTGGNTGSQSATLVIRAMALGDIRLRWRDLWFVCRKELPVALALGAAVAVLEVILAHFSKGVGIEVLLIVGLSMFACTFLGGVVGVLLPFAARRMGSDPATLSAPLLTSIMDILGMFIYFGFAYLILGSQLV